MHHLAACHKLPVEGVCTTYTPGQVQAVKSARGAALQQTLWCCCSPVLPLSWFSRATLMRLEARLRMLPGDSMAEALPAPRRPVVC